MDEIFHTNNIRPRLEPLNNILTKENYKWLVIAIGLGWEIEYKQCKQILKQNPEWSTQGEYLAHLWNNHNRVNPFFIRNLQKTCEEKLLGDKSNEFLKLKDLLSRFSRTQNRSRKIQNDNLLIEFEKLKVCIAQFPHSVSDTNEIRKDVEKLQSTLNGIIQDWKENNNYIFFKNGKWHNRHHDIIADPTEFLSPNEIEAFENELDQTENQLKIFNGFRIEIDKHMSVIRNIATQNSSTFSKSNSQEKKVEPITQLKTKLTGNQRGLLFSLLGGVDFIPKDTDKDGFMWAFGEFNDKISSFKTTWLVDAVFLTDLLREIKKDEITLEEMKVRAKSFFVNKKGEKVKIDSYKKKKEHPNYKKIMKIINTVQNHQPE